MDHETFWAACALVLVFEGLLPFASPRRWRDAFQRLASLPDAYVRAFGLVCLLGGVALLAWQAH